MIEINVKGIKVQITSDSKAFYYWDEKTEKYEPCILRVIPIPEKKKQFRS